jgi:hypothetical protein
MFYTTKINIDFFDAVEPVCHENGQGVYYL